MQTRQYSIVLPISNDIKAIEAFFLFRMPLYEKFLDKSEISKFVFITPNDSIDLVQFRCHDILFAWQVVSDDRFIDSNLIGARGWYKQQLIKLSISDIIDTEHYLLIDDDLFLTQPMYYSDMIVNGRIIYSNESWTNDGPNFATNSRWWIGSCNLLDYNINSIIESRVNMGVTPQLMITSEARSMVSSLYSKYGKDWKKMFIEYGATEYASYWVYLLKNNKDTLYTPIGKKMFEMDHMRNILNPGLNLDQVRSIVSNSFIDRSQFFSVVQSWIGYDSRWYSDIIKKII